VFANIALSWRLARNLALLGVYYENRTDTSQPLTVVSPIAQPIVFESFRDRGLFLTLRFDARAGQSTAPLGGRPGDGAGRVSGIVYLDANDDGRLEAGEQGASKESGARTSACAALKRQRRAFYFHGICIVESFSNRRSTSYTRSGSMLANHACAAFFSRADLVKCGNTVCATEASFSKPSTSCNSDNASM